MTENDLKKYLLNTGKVALHDDNGVFKTSFIGVIGIGETPDQALDDLCNKVCKIVRAIDIVDEILETNNAIEKNKASE